MKSLNFTIVLAVLLGISTFAIAQEKNQDYLGAVVIFLDNGDCVKAEKNYNDYKKLSGKTSPTIERLISECKGSGGISANGPKQVQISYQDYEVLPADLDVTYTWSDAKSVCAKLKAFKKSDWYLPNKTELDGLYKYKEELGGFTEYSYWSSTEYYSGYAWTQKFENGYRDYEDKRYYRRVRCIRKD